MTINLYQSKKYQEYYDQLRVITESNEKSFSSAIGKAVKMYVNNISNNKPLIADREDWEGILNGMTREEKLQMSTLICELNNIIIRKCQQ